MSTDTMASIAEHRDSTLMEHAPSKDEASEAEEPDAEEEGVVGKVEVTH
jgi:hypothetical protein